MKTIIKILALATVFFGSALVLTGCDEEQLNPIDNTSYLELRGNGQGRGNGQVQGNCSGQDSCRNLPKEDLSTAERDALLFMVEEEKMARDLYAAFYAKWQAPVFDRIRQSEQKHMESVGYLLEKYELKNSTTDLKAGEFSVPELQTLYQSILDKGMASVTEAYAAGALVEETDIDDLQSALKNDVDNADLTLVFNNLSAASGRHLKSFVSNLSAAGITYTPVVLSATDYTQWLNTNSNGPNAKGQCEGTGNCNQGGQGKGQGRGQGRNRG